MLLEAAAEIGGRFIACGVGDLLDRHIRMQKQKLLGAFNAQSVFVFHGRFPHLLAEEKIEIRLAHVAKCGKMRCGRIFGKMRSDIVDGRGEPSVVCGEGSSLQMR